jgi:hypothetical protein
MLCFRPCFFDVQVVRLRTQALVTPAHASKIASARERLCVPERRPFRLDDHSFRSLGRKAFPDFIRPSSFGYSIIHRKWLRPFRTKKKIPLQIRI